MKRDGTYGTDRTDGTNGTDGTRTEIIYIG